MDIKDLRKIAEQYFSDNVSEMYATEDGNFFYPFDKKHAQFHATSTKQELHTIKAEKQTKKEIKEEPKTDGLEEEFESDLSTLRSLLKEDGASEDLIKEIEDAKTKYKGVASRTRELNKLKGEVKDSL